MGLSISHAEPLVPAIPFKHVKNLSQLTVNDIEQDYQGFIWLANNAGVDRFDGYTTKNYLSHSGKVSKLFVDKNNQLFALSHSGLFRYEYKKDQFIKALSADTNELDFSQATDVYAIDRRILIATSEGELFEFKESRLFKVHHVSNPQTQAMGKNAIYTIKKTDDGQYLLGTNYGLWQLDLESDAEPIASTKEYTVRAIDSLPNGQLFLATNKGLLSNGQGGTTDFSRVVFDNAVNTNLRDLVTEGNDFLWIASFDGLIQLDLNSNQTRVLKRSSNEQNSLASNVIKSLKIDRSGLLWIGTEDSGASLAKLQNKVMETFLSKDQIDACMSGDTIYAMANHEQYLWFAVWGKGVHQIDKKTGSCQILELKDAEGKSIHTRNVISLNVHQDNLWIGHSSRGLTQLNLNSNMVMHFDSKSEQDLVHPAVYDVEVDQTHRVWVATGLGLSRFDLSMNQFTNFTTRDSAIYSDNLNVVSIDNTNNLWIGGEQGIDLFDIENYRFDRAQLPESLRALSSPIYSLLTTSKDGIWIGTMNKGLWLWSRSGAVKHWQVDTGLPDNTIYNIQQDAKGMIWASTNKGVFMLDPISEDILIIGQHHSAKHNEYTMAGFYDYEDQAVYFAGVAGISQLRTNISQLPQSSTEIVAFLVNNKIIDVTEQGGLTQNIAMQASHHIGLDYTYDFVGFQFSSLNYFDAPWLRYRYRLTGYSDSWIETDASNRVATYTNLPHGDFTLHVDATDALGQWQNNFRMLKITVTPPFWLTIWAKIAYVLALIILPIVIFNYRSRALLRKAAQLEQAVTLRTQELDQQKRHVERLLQYKNEEFANVSHEFRTPLTLVLGPIKKLIDQEKDLFKKDKLAAIKNNAYRMLRMVDQLIFMEKFRVKKELQKELVNVSSIVTEYSTNFKDLAKEKDIEITTNITPDILFETIPDAIHKITLNLLSNALKYTSKGGRIKVELTSDGANRFIFEVSDSGIGIDKAMQEEVFKRYTRVRDRNSEKVTGAGIGLALVKELVEYHHGEIHLVSETGKGSTFSVSLPRYAGSASDREDRTNPELLDIELENIQSQMQQQLPQQTESISWASEQTFENTILIIDDNPDIRAYLKEVLQDEFNILQAADGEQGVQVAQEYVPDLIVSDVMMPVKDGFELTQTLKTNLLTSHIPIILLTARGDRESKLKGWSMNADEYLIKPFDETEIKLRINNLLSIRKLIQMRFAGHISPAVNAENSAHACNQNSHSDDSMTQMDKQFFENCNSVLRQHYQQSDFGALELATNIGLSLRQLQRKLKALLGMSPSEYIRNYRLERAKEALQKGSAIKVVAFDHGFSSVSYFARCYKAYFGETPGSHAD